MNQRRFFQKIEQMVETISENLQRKGTLTSEEVKEILDGIKK